MTRFVKKILSYHPFLRQNSTKTPSVRANSLLKNTSIKNGKLSYLIMNSAEEVDKFAF